MHGTETLNKASESIARSTRVAVETGKTNVFHCQFLGKGSIILMWLNVISVKLISSQCFQQSL